MIALVARQVSDRFAFVLFTTNHGVDCLFSAKGGAMVDSDYGKLQVSPSAYNVLPSSSSKEANNDSHYTDVPALHNTPDYVPFKI